MGQSDKPEEPPAPEVRANQVRSSLGAPVIGLRLPPDLLETWWERRSSCTASDRSFSATAHRVAISCFSRRPRRTAASSGEWLVEAGQHRSQPAYSAASRNSFLAITHWKRATWREKERAKADLAAPASLGHGATIEGSGTALQRYRRAGRRASCPPRGDRLPGGNYDGRQWFSTSPRNPCRVNRGRDAYYCARAPQTERALCNTVIHVGLIKADGDACTRKPYRPEDVI
jgi:hypothetical protein